MISLGWSSIDAVLGGGLRPCRLTELCGSPGSGKTALTIKCISEILRQDDSSKVIILSNLGYFPVVRLISMLKSFVAEENIEGCLDRVHISYIFEVEELVQVVEHLIEENDPNTKLIVIDNAANFFRGFAKDQIEDKMCALRYCGMLLRRLARKCNVPVLFNNHLTSHYRVRDRPDSGVEYVPYLGDTWTLMLDFRIRLDRASDEPGHRKAWLSKSTYSVPSDNLKQFEFIIKEGGIIDLGICK